MMHYFLGAPLYSAVILDKSTDLSSVNLRTLVLDLSMQYSLSLLLLWYMIRH